MPSRSAGRSSIAKLHSYLTRERVPGTREIVERGVSFYSDNILDPEHVVQEMEAVANSCQTSDPVAHFQLSWPPDEKPTEQEWKASAEKAIRDLGYGEHQYGIHAHNDKEHFHVHVQVNKVHPDTYRPHHPYLDAYTLHKSCRELERQYGWKETRGVYRWDTEANEPRLREPGHAPQPEPAEIHRGDVTLKSYAAGMPAKELRDLLSEPEPKWQQVHALLARHDLEIQKAEKGGYSVARIGAPEIRAKASDVFRSTFAGKAQREGTEKLLGPFEPKALGAAFTAPTVDYDQIVSRTQRLRDAGHVHQSYLQSYAPRPETQRPHNLPNLPGDNVVRARVVPQMLVQGYERGDARGDTRHLRILRRGDPSKAQEGRGVGTDADGIKETQAERNVAWKQTQRTVSADRRAERVKERADERKNLKQEFAKVQREQKSLLHVQTVQAREQRKEHAAQCKAQRQAVRGLDTPFIVKKAMLSVLALEQSVEKRTLNLKLKAERAAVPTTTYEHWVEQLAEKGDQRAAAQMRGWRYQDARTTQQIDRDSNGTKIAGTLSADAEAIKEKGAASDWTELSNARIRQLRDDARYAELLKTVRWKANAKTGEITYHLAGKTALIDRGKNITVLHHDKDATKVALQMALHKYGKLIDAKGTPEWQNQLIQVTVENKITVAFTDPQLQARLVAARQAQKPARTRDKDHGRER